MALDGKGSGRDKEGLGRRRGAVKRLACVQGTEQRMGLVHGVAALGRHPVPRAPEALRVSLLQIHAPRVVLWLDEQVTPQPLAL